MENSSAASASSEAGSSRSQEIEELERFIDSYVLEYQVQGLLTDKTEGDMESQRTQAHISQVSTGAGTWQTQWCGTGTLIPGSVRPLTLQCQVWLVPQERPWEHPASQLCVLNP